MNCWCFFSWSFQNFSFFLVCLLSFLCCIMETRKNLTTNVQKFYFECATSSIPNIFSFAFFCWGWTIFLYDVLLNKKFLLNIFLWMQSENSSFFVFFFRCWIEAAPPVVNQYRPLMLNVKHLYWSDIFLSIFELLFQKFEFNW